MRDLQKRLIEEGGENAREAKVVEEPYIEAWERLHAACTNEKLPEDLKVCYLAGPEPLNDFEVLYEHGVLPQNIWAFESEAREFKQALEQCAGRGFSQPKLIKMPLERFLRSVPVTFDIAYLDFCSALLSSRRSLSCVADLFYNHRLASPGVLITNFSEVPREQTHAYVELIARYFLMKRNASGTLGFQEERACAEAVQQAEDEACKQIDMLYGELLTSLICNMASVSVPAQRFANSDLRNFLVADADASSVSVLNADCLDKLSSDSLLRALFCADGGLGSDHPLSMPENKVAAMLAKCIAPHGVRKGPLESLGDTVALREGYESVNNEVERIASGFANSHRFLDLPERSLYVDYSIRQLSHPMHYCPDSSVRFTYRAKEKRMFADAIAFDDCRYVYDWLPAAFQGSDALADKSWLYVFRFALDGLIKQRLAMDSDFLYRGSVVTSSAEGFECSRFSDRIALN